jgi:DNA-binding response OmpR family regulator
VAGNVIKIRDVVLDSKAHVVTKNGVAIDLFPREFALLEHMMRHPNQVFSADELLDRVWSSDTEASPHTVRSCINRLRDKLDADGEESFIRTTYSVGYSVPS